MKELESEFIKNVDKCGDNKFTLVKREDNVALYHRTDMNDNTVGYEAFFIKIVKAGTKLPNNLFVEEDYEHYPTKNEFGKIAYFCSNLARGEERFNELLRCSKAKTAAETTTITVIDMKGEDMNTNENTVTVSPAIKFPDGEWTIKNAQALNREYSPAKVYQLVRALVNNGKVAVVGHRKGGRGKPTVIYKSV